MARVRWARIHRIGKDEMLTFSVREDRIAARNMVPNQLPLIHALIDAYLFLERSGPEEVDPDLAVRCMENMSASLLQLDECEQIVLRSQFQEIAANSKDASYSEFVRQMPDWIGLAGESSDGI